MFLGELGNMVRAMLLLKIIGFSLVKRRTDKESECVWAHANTHMYECNIEMI